VRFGRRFGLSSAPARAHARVRGDADIAVIGAGMAGASLAAELAPHASVILLEGETLPGYHATGRSAAFWSESYGGPHILPLTAASGPFLADPPAEFHDRSFLGPRGALSIADADGMAALEAFSADFAGLPIRLERVDRPALEARIAGIKPRWTAAMFEPDCSDIDVAALHGAYLKAFRRDSGILVANAEVEAIRRQDGGWRLETRAGDVRAGEPPTPRR